MNIVANSPTATIATVNSPYRNALYFIKPKSNKGTLPIRARRISVKMNPAIRIAPAMKQTAGTEMLLKGHEKLPMLKDCLGMSQPYVWDSMNPKSRLERPRVTRITQG